MRKSIFNLLGGAVFCLSLVFSSCGNIDNPLEEIVNSNPTAAYLKMALDKGAVFTINFNLNGDKTVTFKKGEEGYELDGVDEGLYLLDYDDASGMLILTILSEELIGGEHQPISQIFFNPKDESFYILNGIGQNITSTGEFSVNGAKGTLTNSCPDKATIEISISGMLMGTRTGVFTGGNLFIYYNKEKGEKWKDVVDRYATSDFDGLFSVDGDNNNVALKYGYDTGDVMYDNETKVLVTDVVGKKAGAAYDSNYKATLSAIGPS